MVVLLEEQEDPLLANTLLELTRAGGPASLVLPRQAIRAHAGLVVGDDEAALVLAGAVLVAVDVLGVLLSAPEGGVCLAVTPGNSELDLKALAKLAGDRKMELAPLREVQPLTGYIRGGVTALAGKKDYPVFVDETALLFDRISISAGARGTQMLLNPADYLRVVNATTGPIAKPAL